MASRLDPQPSLEKVQTVLAQLDNSVLVRFLLLLASGWGILQMLKYFEIVVVIFVIATILAFLLSYPVRWCRRFIPHGMAVFVVF
ncbi:MAG: AI-2E family transporter, partial [Leptolyngbyaceae cyanobacterium MAG.088]|nr:AI-2E family transporter [Leptolyngbyaceae cyanobacterium MAG.088]